MPLEYLSSFGDKGVRNINLDNEGQERTYSGGGIPDELWRMTDFIVNHGKDCPGSLFLERGDEMICKGIRECLDTAREFDISTEQGEIGVLSMAETLLRFLEALPTSIIPASFYEKVIRIGEYRGSIVEVHFSFGIMGLMVGYGYFAECIC